MRSDGSIVPSAVGQSSLLERVTVSPKKQGKTSSVVAGDPPWNFGAQSSSFGVIPTSSKGLWNKLSQGAQGSSGKDGERGYDGGSFKFRGSFKDKLKQTVTPTVHMRGGKGGDGGNGEERVAKVGTE
jgi:hypothetical protein